MANKGVVPASRIVFAPGAANTGTVFFNHTDYDSIALSDIMLITNVTNGKATIIYDPFDSTKGGTLATETTGTYANRKKLTLAFSTVTMSSGDSLQVILGYTEFSSTAATESTLADIKTSAQLIDDSVATAGSTAPTKAIQVSGTDGTNNARILSTNASGHVNIADGGNTITVDGTVSISNSSVAVTGSFLTNTELRATAVPVSISSGTVTANIGTPNGLALDATLIGGTVRTKITDGTNNAAVKAALAPAVAADTALVVALSPNQSPATPMYVSIVEPPVATTASTAYTKLITIAGSSNYERVKSGSGKLNGWYIYNNANSFRRVLFHDSNNTTGSVPSGSAVFSIVVPPFSAANVSFPSGAFSFTNGLGVSIAADISNTSPGIVTGILVNDMIITLFYK